jgi:hypothetical protein
MPTYNIVVFGGDYAGPEVRHIGADSDLVLLEAVSLMYHR